MLFGRVHGGGVPLPASRYRDLRLRLASPRSGGCAGTRRHPSVAGRRVNGRNGH